MGSIYDVASACGVSVATVSRVLNGHRYVRGSMREKVLDAVRETGYRPKQTARRDCFAIVVESSDSIQLNGYTSDLVAELSQVIFRRGYRLEILAAEEISLIPGKGLLGVFSVVYTPASCDKLRKLSGVPVVSINAPAAGHQTIVSNDCQGLRLAVDHLVERGHVRIAMLCGAGLNWNTRERQRGFRVAMEGHGLAKSGGFIQPVDDWQAVLPPLLRVLKKKPSALIVCGEYNGIVVAHALHLLERRVPEDLSLITFERRGISEYCTPAQTTIGQNFKQISTFAMEMLLGEETVNGAKAPRVFVDYVLTDRDSVSVHERREGEADAG